MAVQFVQANGGQSTGPVTLTSVTSGNNVAIFFCGGATLASTTLPAGWQKQTEYGTNPYGVWWVYPNHPGGSISASVTSPPGDPGWSILEYTGGDADAPVFGTAGNTGSASTWSSGSVSTVTDGAMAVGVVMLSSSFTNTFTGSFTSRSQVDSHSHAVGDYDEIPSGGTETATGSTSANPWVVCSLVLNPDGTAPPPVVFTAIGAKTGADATPNSIDVAHPAGTAASQILVAGRCTWRSSAECDPSDETGWTNQGELAGGTGTAADAHTTIIRADTKELSGSDAGPTSFDQTGTPSTTGGATGVIASYTKADSGATWDVENTTGDDAGHAANRSATGSATIDFAVGDVLVAIAAVDTDAALTITAPALTASGITFSTTNRRTSGAGSTTGNDGNIELFDATVTAGSATVAPTLAFTTGTSQCGPVSFVRLRSVSAGGGATATPGVIALTVAVPAVTPQAGTTTAPAVIARSLTVPAVTAQAGASTSPAVIARTVAVPAVTTAAGATSSPAVVPLAVSLPVVSATGGGSATATPAVTPLSFALPAPTPQAGTTVTPAQIVTVIAVPAATASGASAGTATPTAVTVAATLGAATATGGGSTSPAVIARTILIPAATASGATTGTATPTVITLAVALPAASPRAGTTTAPTQIVVAVTIPATSAGGSQTISPAVIARTILIPAVTKIAGTGATATPAVIARSFTLPAPTLRYGSTVTPATIPLLFVLPSVVPPFVIGDATSYLVGADAASILVGAGASSILEPYAGLRPDHLIGLAVWLDADDPATFTLAGSQVTEWWDQSTGAHHFGQAAGPTCPTRDATIGDRPAVRFTGASGQLITAAAFASAFTAAEMFVVLRNVTEATSAGFMGGAWGTSGSAQHYPFSDGQVYEPWGTTIRHTLGNPTPSLLDPHLYNVRTAPGSYVAEINGAPFYSSASNTVGFGAGTVGFGFNSFFYFDGVIAEFVMYNRVLTADERLDVEDYLQTKWGL